MNLTSFVALSLYTSQKLSFLLLKFITDGNFTTVLTVIEDGALENNVLTQLHNSSNLKWIVQKKLDEKPLKSLNYDQIIEISFFNAEFGNEKRLMKPYQLSSIFLIQSTKNDAVAIERLTEKLGYPPKRTVIVFLNENSDPIQMFVHSNIHTFTELEFDATINVFSIEYLSKLTEILIRVNYPDNSNSNIVSISSDTFFYNFLVNQLKISARGLEERGNNVLYANHKKSERIIYDEIFNYCPIRVDSMPQ